MDMERSGGLFCERLPSCISAWNIDSMDSNSVMLQMIFDAVFHTLQYVPCLLQTAQPP